MLALAVATLSLALAGPAATASAKPRIAVTDKAPFTVRGMSFMAGERVTVVAQTPRRHVRSTIAGARGAFVVRFAMVRLGGCTAYFVRATGSRGSSAVLKVVPVCPPPQPIG